MTSQKRLFTAFRCQQPDRVPIIVRGVNPYAKEMNWRGEADPSYQPLIQRVREVCDVEDLWYAGDGFALNGAEIDIKTEETVQNDWRITTRSIDTPRGPLTSIYRAGTTSYAHGWVKPWISDEDDVERFLALDYRPLAPKIDEYYARCEQLGSHGYVLAYLDDAIGQVHALLGSELLSMWSIENTRLLHLLLETMNERCLDLADRLLKDEDVPVFGIQGQETVVPPLMSPTRFDELVVRYDVPLIERVHEHGSLLYVHCHGALNAVLGQFDQMGIDILHPIEAPPMGDISLSEAKRRVGDRICLAGNIQIGDIMTLDREQIVASTRQAIDEGARGGGFVLTLTATPFEKELSQQSLDNLLAMIDTSLEYGSYG